ncbi:MAG: carboxylating nicotinate-nucleotide diphosphorylase [Gammaproteobacteria bacterium AqS3]|nr:carboxylating nicotinate-nucleotide diphosphorylase [Gammaproteobacteria bacterium AqS3]
MPRDYIKRLVRSALDEDIGSGDLSAQLVPRRRALARIVVREAAVLCGCGFAEGVFAALDPDCRLGWCAGDGDALEPDQTVLEVEADVRALLSGERTALNFLQLLSGTATAARRWSEAAAASGVRVRDTRKTLPGLRLAQKYAVRIGGADNHRIGLFDAFLLKENHIAAAGGLPEAVAAVRSGSHADAPLQIEVETFEELQSALELGVESVLLDNFSVQECTRAAALVDGRIHLEASGSINLDTLAAYIATGVDCISSGALTKHVRAVDFSMNIQ